MELKKYKYGGRFRRIEVSLSWQVPGGGDFLIGKMRGAKTLPEC